MGRGGQWSDLPTGVVGVEALVYGVRLNVFWESNPTNIESPVFRGNTAITLITQKTLRDPGLPMFSLCLSAIGVWDSSVL